MTYDSLLKNAPAQDSPEFLAYLRANNRVVLETDAWLVIENVKYHTEERAWLTAFAKGDARPLEDLEEWAEWEWLKKDSSRQTLPGRFHIHLYRNTP